MIKDYDPYIHGNRSEYIINKIMKNCTSNFMRYKKFDYVTKDKWDEYILEEDIDELEKELTSHNNYLKKDLDYLNNSIYDSYDNFAEQYGDITIVEKSIDDVFYIKKYGDYLKSINLIIEFDKIDDLDIDELMNGKYAFFTNANDPIMEITFQMILLQSYLLDSEPIITNTSIKIPLFIFDNFSKEGLPLKSLKYSMIYIKKKSNLKNIQKYELIFSFQKNTVQCKEMEVLIFDNYIANDSMYDLCVGCYLYSSLFCQLFVAYLKNNTDSINVPIITSLGLSVNDYEYLYYTNIITINFGKTDLYVIPVDPTINTIDKLKKAFVTHNFNKCAIPLDKIEKLKYKYEFDEICNIDKKYIMVETHVIKMNVCRIMRGIMAKMYI